MIWWPDKLKKKICCGAVALRKISTIYSMFCINICYILYTAHSLLNATVPSRFLSLVHIFTLLMKSNHSAHLLHPDR